MIRKLSPPIMILIVLIVVLLAIAASGFNLFQKERAKTIELQNKVEDLTTRQRITEAKLDETKKLAADLQAKLQDAKSQVDSLSSELEQEKTARQEERARLEQIKADLEQQKNLRTDLEKKFNQAQDEIKKAQARLKDLDSEKAKLEAKVKEAESQGVELGNIVVRETAPAYEPLAAVAVSATAAPLPAPVQAENKPSGLEGKILVVNKDYNFAVINLGSKDGVAIGDMFSVYHDNKYVGDLKAEKVHDSMVAAGFVTADIKAKLSEGDKAVQKGK